MTNDGLTPAGSALKDTVAARTIRLSRNVGLSVPGDISVTGCNNFDLAQLMTPTITTFDLPVRQPGKDAAACLVEQLQNPSPLEERRCKPMLIARESSGPCRISGTE